MRIALYHGLPPGGAKRAAYEQAKRLSQRHVLSEYSLGATDQHILDISAIASRSRSWSFTPRVLWGYPLRRFNQLLRILDAYQLREESIKFSSLIDRDDQDICLIHHCQYMHTPWILQSLKLKTVYYCNEHNRLIEDIRHSPSRNSRPAWKRAIDKVDPLEYAYRQLLRFVERKGLQAASRVLLNSQYMAGEIEKRYSITAQVCYLGVEPQEFPALSLDSSGYVLSVGAIAPRKGYDLIVQGLGRLPKTIRPQLVIVGYNQVPDELAYLRTLAQQNDVQLEWKVNASHRELVELYNRALAVVYTPRSEPFGLVPLEAMSCGVPVIGVNEGGVAETILDGITGRLIERDPEILAWALLELLASPESRKEMGTAGRRHVEENWSWDQSVRRLEGHLLEVIR
jgi:glycosyltransferase involved in cell wall biosynthesis